MHLYLSGVLEPKCHKASGECGLSISCTSTRLDQTQTAAQEIWRGYNSRHLDLAGATVPADVAICLLRKLKD